MIGLALAYLRDRPLMTALNILLLALAVATLVMLLSVSTQLGERFERDAQGIDLVVGAKGSPLQLILSSIYQMDTPPGNIPLESVALLRRDPSVRQAIPLAMGDNFRGYRIVGTEPSYLTLQNAKLAKGRMFGKAQEVVIGARVAQELNASVFPRHLRSLDAALARGELAAGGTGRPESMNIRPLRLSAYLPPPALLWIG